MKSTHIVLLAEVSAARVIGGAERMLRGHALGLRRLGYRVGLAVREPQDDPRPTVLIGDAPEHRYAVQRANEAVYMLSSLQASIGGFERACDDAKPDAVIVHQAMAGLGPILWHRSSAGAWVYMCLSLAHEEYLSRTAPASVSRLRYLANVALRRWCERAVMRRCACVIVLSEFMKQRVQAVHGIAGDRVRVIPGAVDIERFTPATDPVDVRRQLKLPLDRTILVTVRNLVPRMGLEQFVRAVAMVRDEIPGILAIIGGEGPLREELQRLIQQFQVSDHVRMTGFIPEDDLQKYYQAADLVVMPTYELEGFGLVTIEAMACGTPVLGTPVGATPEILRGIDPALLSGGTQAEAMAESLRTIMRRFRARPGERAELAAKGVQAVRANYTWDRHCSTLADVLAGVCRRSCQS